jgi:hypothetical protein
VAFVASLVLVSSADAGIIYKGVDYGGIDTGTGYNLSGCGTLVQCEEATLAGALGVSIDNVSLTKVDTTVSDWISVDDGNASTNLVAFNFGAFGITDPLAYIVKVGNAVYDFYLYTNSASLQYALIDLNAIQAKNGNITVSSLSHISKVPEAGSLSLLLSGLAALSLVSARRSRLLR